MKRFFVFICFLFGLIYSSYSQEVESNKPDYDRIKEAIQDSSSIFFYPQLMARFELSDPTLTEEEYKHLYYGYLFQEDYKPFRISPEEKEMEKYYNKVILSKKDYDKIIQLATSALSKYPFDLRQMNFLAYVYHLKGDETLAMQTANKLNAIREVILSSGNGQTCETAYHVISINDEYDILKFFQLEIKSRGAKAGCDYFSLKKKSDIYFDISQFFATGFKVKK
ncbi:MAG: DUF4919 domain-containing protein [Candidatus Symbiothrix sp.]|jgi:hypothetical protein|nr:DUF4919 domain-containing protein [Candidatus Symbiothrix sp.]